MTKSIQNFYKSTLSLDWSIGTGIFYVTTKPVITDGWLVVSPNNATIREIIKYTSTGSDSNGDYVVISERGVSNTDEQTHSIGEPIRMNITAEYWEDMNTAINDIVAAGAPNAATDTKGLVEIATDAEVSAQTDTGTTGAKLVATPSQIKLLSNIVIPIVRTYLNAASPATWTKPTGLKYIIAEVQAGGGGGGFADAAFSENANGGGGGGGGYSKKLIAASSLGATETITIGTGGVGATVTTGGTGGTSSFGSHCSATGGTGGEENGPGGNGGTSTGGDLNITGGLGIGGMLSPDSIAKTGIGGNSFLGGNGNIYGGGGNGGLAGSDQEVSGGAGGTGIVIVTEYY